MKDDGSKINRIEKYWKSFDWIWKVSIKRVPTTTKRTTIKFVGPFEWVSAKEWVCVLCVPGICKQCAHHNHDNNLKQFWFKNSMSKRIWHTYFTHFLQQTSPIQHSTLHTHMYNRFSSSISSPGIIRQYPAIALWFNIVWFNDIPKKMYGKTIESHPKSYYLH